MRRWWLSWAERSAARCGVDGRRGHGLTVVHGLALASANPLRGSTSSARRRLRRPPRSPSLPRPKRAASRSGGAPRAATDARSVHRTDRPASPFVSGRLPQTARTPTPAATAATSRAVEGLKVAVTVAAVKCQSLLAERLETGIDGRLQDARTDQALRSGVHRRARHCNPPRQQEPRRGDCGAGRRGACRTQATRDG